MLSRKLCAQLGAASLLITLVAASPAMAANYVDQGSAACSDSRSAADTAPQASDTPSSMPIH